VRTVVRRGKWRPASAGSSFPAGEGRALATGADREQELRRAQRQGGQGRGDTARLSTRGTLRRVLRDRDGRRGAGDSSSARVMPERPRTPGPVAGCNRPARSCAEQTVEVVRNHEGGTRCVGWLRRAERHLRVSGSRRTRPRTVEGRRLANPKRGGDPVTGSQRAYGSLKAGSRPWRPVGGRLRSPGAARTDLVEGTGNGETRGGSSEGQRPATVLFSTTSPPFGVGPATLRGDRLLPRMLHGDPKRQGATAS
jgi:hypothetical protein